MPELPEVETVRRGLEAQVLGRRIDRVEVRCAKIVRTDLEAFSLELPGRVITGLGRRGKYLLIKLGELVLVSHLRMEGKSLLFPDAVPENKHFHVLFGLDNGATLVYQDVRKFGTMELLPAGELDAYFAKKKLGPEPTEDAFDLAAFAAGLARSKKPVKTHLLDQTLVVGLGNIYVDEALWAAQIHPQRPSQSLTPDEITRLRKEIIRILALAVAQGGSTIRTYHNSFGEDGTMQEQLQVYGQTGQPCPRCGTAIEKITLGGRGTHLCPSCQKKKGA